jgi:hypothetical protein
MVIMDGHTISTQIGASMRVHSRLLLERMEDQPPKDSVSRIMQVSTPHVADYSGTRCVPKPPVQPLSSRTFFRIRPRRLNLGLAF